MNFGEIAARYRAAGWTSPFPLPRGAKSPPPANVTGANGRQPTDDDFAAWASHEGNVGLRLQDGLVALDEDVYTKDGVVKKGDSDLAELEERWGKLPATWVNSARPVGGHRFYRVPTGMHFVRGHGALDILQTGHRYSVVAPSTHPDLGTAYTWRDPNGRPYLGPTFVPQVSDLPALPAAWVEGLRDNGELRKSAGYTPAESMVWLSQLRPGDMCQVVRGNLDAAKASLVNGGGRHDNMCSGTWALVSQGLTGHAGVRTALMEFEEAFVSAVGRSDAEAEYARAVTQAVDKLAVQAHTPGQSCSCDLPVTDGLPDLDDESLARWLLSLKLPERLKYVVGSGDGLWATFQDTHWTVSRDSSWAETAIRRAMFTQLQAERDALEPDAPQIPWIDKVISKVGDSGKVTGIVRAVRATEDYRSTVDAFDRDPHLLNLRNGSLDLRELRLKDHVAEDMQLRMAPCSFEADSLAPVFSAALSRVLPDPEIKDYLQRLLGQTLLGADKEQIFSVWYGRGANMKSALLKILQGVLGEYVYVTQDDFLIRKQSRGHETALASIEGCRFLFTSEAGHGDTLDSALVKSLTGEATLNARKMYQDSRSFPNTWGGVFMLTNFLPTVDAFDDGLFRRLQVLPFEVVVPKEEQDLHLPDKVIATESAGVLQWLLEGLRSYRERGLDVPDKVVDYTKSFRANAEPVAVFVTDMLVDQSQAWVSTAHVAKVYEEWAVANAEAVEVRKLQTVLAQRYATAKREGKRGYQGVAVR